MSQDRELYQGAEGRSQERCVLRKLGAVVAAIGLAACAIGAGGEDAPSVTRAAALERQTPSDRSSPMPDALVASCGNGVVDPGEDCDEGALANASTACSSLCRSRDLVVPPPAALPDGGAFQRVLGSARHAVAAGPNANGFAITYVESNPTPHVAVRIFDADGVPVGAPIVLESPALVDANPSIAAIGNKYALAWTTNARVDEQDVLLALVDPATAAITGPILANSTTVAAQYDADLVAIGSQIVVAWTDTSDPSNGPDVRYRAFDATTLTAASSGDLTIAATPAAEGSVALSPFGSGFVAAWRDEQADGERLQVAGGAARWTIGPYVAGATGDRPAVVALDASHLLIAYSTNTDPTDSGTANVSALQAAVLDANARSATPLVTPTSSLGQDQPSAAVVRSTAFLAWHQTAATGDPLGEELWLKPLTWNGSSLDTSTAAMPLPRWPVHQQGDQRQPALAASTIAGGSLVMTWNDLGQTFGASEGQGDAVYELAPVPIARGSGTPNEPPTCPSGQRYCNGACTSTSTNPNNCGQCGFVCDPVANGSPACVAGACVASCTSGFHACGYACSSNTSAQSCGTSCTPCSAPANAQPTCDGTTCGFACVAGYHACGGACAGNGSVLTCGSSCSPCSVPANGQATCDGTSCGVACNSGFHACGSTCADSTSPLTCGSSCTPCAAPSGGSATCVNGACGMACPAGQTVCNGACVSAGDPTENACLVNESFAVFVSASRGSATGDGSRAKPFASVQAGINAAKGAHKAVIACAEAYNESLTLADGVSLWGGFSCTGGSWATTSARALVNASNTRFGVVAVSIVTSTRVDSFQFVTPDATSDASSIGMTAINASGLWLTNCRVHAGSAMNGVDAIAGSSLVQTGGINGNASGNGGTSACTYPNGSPVPSSLNGGNGGEGGAAGTRTRDCGEGPPPKPCAPGKICPPPSNCVWDIEPPGDGSPGGGSLGGAGGVYGGAGAGAGGAGANGTDGASGGAIGTFSQSAGYIASNGGGSATAGLPGSGGGGAAGNPATTTRAGSTGMGGGAGGCPGLQATTATAGGASIAVLAFNSALRIDRSQIESSRGGNGGKGAFGGAGTPGGTGAAVGGAGGRGGNGGSGGGGPSIGLAFTGAAPVLASTTTSLGAAGSGQPAMTSNGTTIPASANGLAQSQYAF